MGVRNRVDRVATRGRTSGVLLVAWVIRVHGGITGYKTGDRSHQTRFLWKLANTLIVIEPALALASKGSGLDTRSTRFPATQGGMSTRFSLWALVHTPPCGRLKRAHVFAPSVTRP